MYYKFLIITIMLAIDLFYNNALIYHLFAPLILIFIIYIAYFFNKNNMKQLYLIALWGTSINTILCIILFLNYLTDLVYIDDILWNISLEININPVVQTSIQLGADSLSYFFLLLTDIFIYLCILHLYHTKVHSIDMLIYLLFLQWGVLGSFCVLDILGFFIFFEVTLIPIYLMILVFGSRERKVRAAYMIAVYTLFGSIFMFFNILYLYSKTGTTDYFQLLTLELNEIDQRFLWITFFIAFASKIPMFPFHVWLPEAHVEAPTVGSVLLAALLLKLGTYGIIRFLLHLYPEATLYFSPLINVFAIMSVLYTSLTALRQIDLKKIIAYSSVGHMNVVLLGLLAFGVENIEGAIFQMLSHGVVSGALFFCVGSFYIRYKVRSLDYFGGLMTTYPLLSVFFLLFSIANISFPGTSNFVGEFMICFGLYSHNTVVVILASLNMIIGAAYTLWAYNRVAFGNLKNQFLVMHTDLKRDEFYLFSFLGILMFLIGIYPSVILNPLHEFVALLVYGHNN